MASPCIGTFSYSGTIESCTVQSTGLYSIVAAGASGGDSHFTSDNSLVGTGGKGAIVAGEIALTAGTIIDLLVGGVGQNGSNYGLPGGGGGTFVVLVDGTLDQPLVIAAGGGGAGFSLSGPANGLNGSTTQTATAETDGTYDSTPGTNGTGGTAGGYFGDNGGGGGYSGTNGGKSTNGSSFLAGGAGGSNETTGGFGGGGGANSGGGGGGGYNGGGGGTTNGGGLGLGGGGGSYLDPGVMPLLLDTTLNTGYGAITFSLLPDTAVPEPATLALLAAALPWACRRRRRG
jgi:hypothetical protein